MAISLDHKYEFNIYLQGEKNLNLLVNLKEISNSTYKVLLLIFKK